jgi:hypothetical protein
VDSKAMASLARASTENKKSSENRQLCFMQLSENYTTETKIINEVQKILLPEWKRNYILFEKTIYRWQRDDFNNGTFEIKYLP